MDVGGNLFELVAFIFSDSDGRNSRSILRTLYPDRVQVVEKDEKTGKEKKTGKRSAFRNAQKDNGNKKSTFSISQKFKKLQG